MTMGDTGGFQITYHLLPWTSGRGVLTTPPRAHHMGIVQIQIQNAFIYSHGLFTVMGSINIRPHTINQAGSFSKVILVVESLILATNLFLMADLCSYSDIDLHNSLCLYPARVIFADAC